LNTEKEELSNLVNDMRQRYDMLERRTAELQETEEKKHEEEVMFLKKTNQQLKVK
jgi:dynein light intermediate chain